MPKAIKRYLDIHLISWYGRNKQFKFRGLNKLLTFNYKELKMYDTFEIELCDSFSFWNIIRTVQRKLLEDRAELRMP